MKTKKNWIITITFLVFVIAFAQVTQVAGKAEQKADTTPRVKFVGEQREVLAELQGVWVLVEGFRPEAEKYGFNTQQYQTDVELRLRQYGVRVLSQKESFKVSGYPYLYINVSPLINEKIGVAAVSIEVRLQEDVLLERNPTIKTSAATWDKVKILLYGLNRLDEVRDSVRNLVDEFINDYYAANPTKNPPVSLPPTKATQTESGGKSGITALYFTQGSHKDDVLRAQGTPDAINRYPSLGKEVWRYGLSRVEFSMRDDRVMQWSNFGNLKVKLEQRRNVTAPTASPSTTKTSQKGLISAIIVSPSAIINDTIVHKGDTIDGVTVIKIQKDRVAFEMKGTNAIIRWTQKIGEAPIEYWE